MKAVAIIIICILALICLGGVVGYFIDYYENNPNRK